jgi:hypothetical protein
MVESGEDLLLVGLAGEHEVTTEATLPLEMNYRTVRHGLKIVELPIHFAERREGESKMNVRVQLESALIPFLLRRRAR